MNLKEGKGFAFDYINDYGAVFICGTMKDAACAEEMKKAAEKYKDVKDLFDKIETDTPCGAQCDKGYLFFIPSACSNPALTTESMIKEALGILGEIGIHNVVVKTFDGDKKLTETKEILNRIAEKRESLADVLLLSE